MGSAEGPFSILNLGALGMKLTFGIIVSIFWCATGWSSNSYSECSGNYECGSEYVIGKDNRVRPNVIQPKVSKPVIGFCKSPLPINQTYNVKQLGVTCGEGAESKDRLPLPVEPSVMDQWDLLSRSGRADAQEEMQRIRQQEIKWSGSINIPMYENWTWDEKVGDFDSRCGMEEWVTTCARDRIENYSVEESYQECVAWAKDEPSPSYGGGSSYGSGGGSSGGSSGYESPFNNHDSGGSSGGAGENLGPSDYDGSSNEYFPSPEDLSLAGMNRAPAGQCTQYATKYRTVWKQRPASRVTYSCRKTRPLYCEWFETRRERRRCQDHTVKYNLEYKKDPAWKPGYVDAKNPTVASYEDILPNKFDLLPGENERVFVFGNSGVTADVTPQVTFENAWNDYSVTASPQSIRCQYGMRPEFNIAVNTNGRILRKAPNPLALPRDEQGNLLSPLKFEELANGKGKPEAIQLQDVSRATLLAAAQNSRNFTRPEGAGEKDPNAIYKDNGTPLKGASASGGYWQESRFRMQLYRHDKWNRLVRVTLPNTFSSNQSDIFEDTITISLKGKDGLERFYRPSGPLDFALGGIYKAFGIELTPGQEYFINLQVVQRGLRFYESGCGNGKAICEGEDATANSYSEPVIIRFVADPNVDQRSWFKKLKDFQEKFMFY